MLGAFPSGKLSEIAGPSSSGASSLLMALIARATSSGGQVAVVDAADAFDPYSAAAAGADLQSLLWVKCLGRLRVAWSVADLLARAPGFTLVALDLGDSSLLDQSLGPGSLWRRLQLAAEQGGAALVLRVPRPLAGSAASLVVSVRRTEARWMGLPRPTRFTGFTSEVRVLRDRARSHSSPREGERIEVQWQL